MIKLNSMLKVIDNSGALMVQCINCLRGATTASLGDEITVVVKRARSGALLAESLGKAGAGKGGAGDAAAKLKRGDVARAVIVRTRKEVPRMDGSFVRFDDNAVVMLNKQGQPIGNRISGVIANECRQKRWAKVVSLAPKIV